MADADAVLDTHSQQQDPAAQTPKTAKTLFTKQLSPFPNPVDGKVATVPFLEGAKGVVSIIGLLGKSFAPVRYDMNGNIQKITVKYKEDCVKFEYLNDMIHCEQAAGANRATDALLWLRRALEFFHNFLLYLLHDSKIEKRPEDLEEYVQRSYEETLKKYHGYVSQKLFKVLSKLVPPRSQLLRSLAPECEGAEEIIFEEMEVFLNNLNSNLTVLAKFFIDSNLNPAVK